jgi:hypothetical protein
MGPQSYMRSVVQNVIMRRMTVVICQFHIMQVNPCGINGGQSGGGGKHFVSTAVFQSHIILPVRCTRDIMCCYSRSILGYCTKGPCLTTPQKPERSLNPQRTTANCPVMLRVADNANVPFELNHCKMKPKYFEECGRVQACASGTSKSKLHAQRN